MATRLRSTKSSISWHQTAVGPQKLFQNNRCCKCRCLQHFRISDLLHLFSSPSICQRQGSFHLQLSCKASLGRMSSDSWREAQSLTLCLVLSSCASGSATSSNPHLENHKKKTLDLQNKNRGILETLWAPNPTLPWFSDGFPMVFLWFSSYPPFPSPLLKTCQGPANPLIRVASRWPSSSHWSPSTSGASSIGPGLWVFTNHIPLDFCSRTSRRYSRLWWIIYGFYSG